MLNKEFIFWLLSFFNVYGESIRVFNLNSFMDLVSQDIMNLEIFKRKEFILGRTLRLEVKVDLGYFFASYSQLKNITYRVVLPVGSLLLKLKSLALFPNSNSRFT